MRARVSRVRSGLTYANVVATLALVLILGSGTAAAHHLIVDSSDVVDGSLAGIDVRDSTLRGADLANQAVSSAKLADNAILPRHLAPAEAWTEVTTFISPALSNVEPTVRNTAGYFKDPRGVVRLKGAVTTSDYDNHSGPRFCFEVGDLWTLPLAYRPAKKLTFTAFYHYGVAPAISTTIVEVRPDGVINARFGDPPYVGGNCGWVSLDGIAFRAGA